MRIAFVLALLCPLAAVADPCVHLMDAFTIAVAPVEGATGYRWEWGDGSHTDTTAPQATRACNATPLAVVVRATAGDETGPPSEPYEFQCIGFHVGVAPNAALFLNGFLPAFQKALPVCPQVLE